MIQRHKTAPAARGCVPRIPRVVLHLRARSELLKNTSERICAPGCIQRSPRTLSSDDRRPVPLCAHRPPSCRRPVYFDVACMGTAAERAVPTAVSCVRATMSDGQCRCVLILVGHRQLCDSRLMQGNSDYRQLTSSCAHGYYPASGPCRLACVSTAAERAVPTTASCVQAAMTEGQCSRVFIGHRRADSPGRSTCTGTAAERAMLTAISCVRAAMFDGPCRRVLMGHCRADGPCRIGCMGTAMERAMPAAVSCVRAAMTDDQCRHVLASSTMVLRLCWMHRHVHCCGAGCAYRGLVHVGGDDRRPMPSFADRHRRANGPCHLGCTSAAAEQAMPTTVSCVRAAMSEGQCRRVLMGHRRADGPCQSACTGTAAERAVPTDISCKRAATTDGPCRRVLIGTFVPTAHAALDARAPLRSGPCLPPSRACERR